MYNKTTNRIYEITLLPIRWLMYILGALPYEFQHKQNCSLSILAWRLLHLTLLVIFTIWISILRFERFHEVLYKRNDKFSNGMDMISYATLLIVQGIIYWETTWKAYRYKIIFKQFELLCHKFKYELKYPINLSRIRLFSILLYTLLMVYMIIILFIILIRYIKVLNGFRLILLQYGDTILKLKFIEFTLFAAIVMAIQTDLNNFMVIYIHEIQKNKFNDAEFKTKIYEKIYILQDIHNILMTTVSGIEDYFCWSLPGLILKMFIEFTITAYWIYFSFDFKIPVLFQSYGYSVTILNLIILFVCCSICSKCEKLDINLSNMFHLIKHEQFNPFLNCCLHEISLQLLHQNIFFSAGGFMDVNYRFLGTYIFSAVCYIVILIQFHMSI
ncbi:gustatory receptor 98a [Cochliomyia hominivorax]